MPRLLAAISAILVSLVTCHAQLDIPRRELGYVYNDGHPCASVKMAAYLDPTCDDSQKAYPTLLKVADHFGAQDLQLTVHMFPLPYHRNSHVISKGAQLIDQFKSTVKNATVFDWFKIIYDNLDKLTPSGSAQLNDIQVLDALLAPMAQTVCGIEPKDFKDGVASGTPIDSNTRLAWKYGCTRGVYGTPMFTVNDVFVNADPSWTVAQWVNLIKPLLKDSRK